LNLREKGKHLSDEMKKPRASGRWGCVGFAEGVSRKEQRERKKRVLQKEVCVTVRLTVTAKLQGEKTAGFKKGKYND